MYTKYQYGDKTYEQPVVTDGIALGVVGIPGNSLSAGIGSTKRAEANIME